MKHLSLPLAGFCSLLCFAPSVFAQKTWIGSDTRGGNGIWQGSHFTPTGVPGASEAVQFLLNGTYSTTVSNIRLQSAVSSGVTRVGRGKEVNFTLASGASWATVGIVAGDKAPVGQTGTGPSHVTFTAESGAGVLKVTQFVVGLDDENPTQTGHSMTFTGEHLRVEVNAASTPTIVGRSNDGSLMFIEDHANVALSSLAIGQTRKDSRVEVTGTGSLLTLSGSSVSGSAALGVGLSAGNANNAIYVASGGEVRITGTNNNHATNVGAVGGAGLGGNLLEVGTGGTFATVGSTVVQSYQKIVGNVGDNRLIVRDQGVFSVTAATRQSITSYGLIQIDAGGELTGNTNISLESGSTFRVAGTGVNIDGTITAKAGSLVEIGASNAAGDVFTLNDAMSMAGTSRLSFTLLDELDYDQFALETGASLNLSAGVLLEFELGLGFVPEAGTVFTLFTGDTSGIVGTLDYSSFDPARWDFSGFNQAGGWQVVAIPEPSSVMLGLGSAVLLLAGMRRKVGAKRKSLQMGSQA